MYLQPVLIHSMALLLDWTKLYEDLNSKGVYKSTKTVKFQQRCIDVFFNYLYQKISIKFNNTWRRDRTQRAKIKFHSKKQCKNIERERIISNVLKLQSEPHNIARGGLTMVNSSLRSCDVMFRSFWLSKLVWKM